MKVCTLASNSKGNSTYVATDNTHILIDAGITLTEIEQKLSIIGQTIGNIDAVLITHEHSDHIKAVGTILRNTNANVYVHTECYPVLIAKIGNIDTSRVVQFFDDDFAIGDIVITPFDVPHDAVHCNGFSLTDGKNKVTIATDLGTVNSEILSHFADSKLAILESNYEPKMLLENHRYPFSLKNRIMGKKGHLSNNLSARVIERLAHMNVTQVVLAHLSEDNNTPDVCYETICSYLSMVGIVVGQNIKIDIAPYRQIGVLYNLR